MEVRMFLHLLVGKTYVIKDMGDNPLVLVTIRNLQDAQAFEFYRRSHDVIFQLWRADAEHPQSVFRPKDQTPRRIAKPQKAQMA